MHPVERFRRALLAAGCGLLTVGLCASAHAQCQLNSPTGKIKHVVYVEFDNVHFTRDNPNVPSDLEQIPNLLNFIKQKCSVWRSCAKRPGGFQLRSAEHFRQRHRLHQSREQDCLLDHAARWAGFPDQGNARGSGIPRSLD